MIKAIITALMLSVAIHAQAARDFNGTGQLNLGAPPELDITGDITAVCWVSLATSSNGYIYGFYNPSGFLGWALQFQNGMPRYWGNGVGSWQYASVGPILGQWSHIGITATGSTGTHYLDGAANGTWVHTAPSSNTANKYLAVHPGGSTDRLNGELADCAIWSAALSADEMASLSVGVSPLKVRPASLVAYWPIFGRTDPEYELINGNAGTVVGTTNAAAHPALFGWASHPHISLGIEAAAVSFPPFLLQRHVHGLLR